VRVGVDGDDVLTARLTSASTPTSAAILAEAVR
jgi:hypothetical protein